jgi:hypothetical protein
VGTRCDDRHVGVTMMDGREANYEMKAVAGKLRSRYEFGAA